MKALTLFLAITLLPIISIAQLRNTHAHSEPAKKIAPRYLSGEEKRAAEIYNRVLPSTVVILTSQISLGENGPSKQDGLGSGVLVSKDCHILTAAHVVDKADKIIVKTQDGIQREAELIFSEPTADIALLRLLVPDHSLPHAHLGNSDSLAVGQRTYVIGNPYGFENSFSVGRISAFREISRLYDGTIPVEFIQTDAAINSGNSGGPMFNSLGEVIGISSQIISVSGGFQGLGLVVAINTAKQLLALEDRVWMGFEARFLEREELGALLNIEAEGGLLVQNVIPGSPAAKAGILKGKIPAEILGQGILLGGDLILEIGEQETCHTACLITAKERIKKQKQIKVKLLRAGKKIETVIDVSGSRKNFLD